MSGAPRFLVLADGTFSIVETPRAPLAWECRDGGPDPSPKWFRLGEGFGDDRNGLPRVRSGRLQPEYLVGACCRESMEAGQL
jgi:hypothetical protein